MRPGITPRDSTITSHRPSGPDPAPVISRPIVTDPNVRDLTIAHLGKVITIVSDKLSDRGQIDTIVHASNLGRVVRYPTGLASPRELWIAVFKAALDEPRGTLELLLDNIHHSLGTLRQYELEAALSEVGLTVRFDSH